MSVRIPYCPRNWARPFHAAPQRWTALVLHRRAGKTTAVLNHHQRASSSRSPTFRATRRFWSAWRADDVPTGGLTMVRFTEAVCLVRARLRRAYEDRVLAGL
jgi:hypothetical protein